MRAQTAGAGYVVVGPSLFCVSLLYPWPPLGACARSSRSCCRPRVGVRARPASSRPVGGALASDTHGRWGGVGGLVLSLFVVVWRTRSPEVAPRLVMLPGPLWRPPPLPLPPPPLPPNSPPPTDPLPVPREVRAADRRRHCRRRGCVRGVRRVRRRGGGHGVCHHHGRVGGGAGVGGVTLSMSCESSLTGTLLLFVLPFFFF